MGLTLEAGVGDAIRAHGVETYPNECCGALYGRDGVVTATFALPNTTEEGPRRRFLVSRCSHPHRTLSRPRRGPVIVPQWDRQPSSSVERRRRDIGM